ncbi:MAG: sugar phosphate isomerase/epimerase [Bryobacterales bacterium]|nr:sugar phosphate isomerase/epimerase [Bryobacterales bacterium]
MSIAIGNAPCSWGVEFPDTPSNPPWHQVLDEASQAGYAGIELGPVGYAPEDPSALADSLAERNLALTAGVVFQPFHQPDAWGRVLDAVHRTCRLLAPLGARQVAFIDSLSPVRSRHAGDPARAPRLDPADLRGLHGRIRDSARIAKEEYGLTACLHAHAGGCLEFEDELDRAMDAIDERLLGLCLDTGHALYAGFDPVAALRRYSSRTTYIHVKDLDGGILRSSVQEGIGFYEACSRGVFCRLGLGDADFAALKLALEEAGYTGWATVEQDRGPASVSSAYEDARANLAFLRSAGLAA